MGIWNQILEMLEKVKDFIVGLSAEQITLLSVGVTFIIFVMGQRSETKFKRLEVRRTEYRKFIMLLQNSLSGNLKVDENSKKEFFDTGASLLLYGSKRVYKKYIFFREYTTNSVVQNSKYNDKEVLMYVVADILKSIRHEVGLTSLSDLESNEILSFFVNNLGTYSTSRINSYKAQYKILMIKWEIFFDNRTKWLLTKKMLYRIVMPVIGFTGLLLKYFGILFQKVLHLDAWGRCKPRDRQNQKQVCGIQDGYIQKDGDSTKVLKQNIIARVIDFEWKLQIKFIKHVWRKSKIFRIIDLVSLPVFIIIIFHMATCNVSSYTLCWALVGMCVATVLFSFLKDSQKAMTSVGSFLKIGICIIFATMMLMMMLCATMSTEILYSNLWPHISWIVGSIVVAIVWTLYSSFCSARVAALANALLTGVISTIVLTKDLLINTFFVELVLETMGINWVTELEVVGITSAQLIDAVSTFILYPPLLMVGLATLGCAAKSYWIVKYNKGCDIEKIEFTQEGEICNLV